MKLPNQKNSLLKIYAAILPLFFLTGSSLRAQEYPAYLDAGQPLESRVEDLLPRLTPEEKVSMVHAKSTFAAAGVPRLGIPELWMDDGPPASTPPKPGWTPRFGVPATPLTPQAITI